MNYTHVTQTERYQIYALRKARQTQKQIAVILKRSESTVSRELRRNIGGRGYRPMQAQKKAAPSLCILGAWDEWKYEWIDKAVLPKKMGLYNDYTTGDRRGNAQIK